jgi:hypothetical protein
VPTRRDKDRSVDKWAALGARRRAYTGGKGQKQAMPPFFPRQLVNNTAAAAPAIGHGHHTGVLHPHNGNTPGYVPHYGGQGFVSYNPLSAHHNNKTHHVLAGNTLRDRVKECPWKKGRENREWNSNSNWRQEKRHAMEDMEWVGGWQESRSPQGALTFV